MADVTGTVMAHTLSACVTSVLNLGRALSAVTAH